MGKMVAVTGNEACANALRQINPDVCGIYPITPQTDMMQRFASYIADGKVDTEPILVESEHSSMSACIGAAAAGGRVALQVGWSSLARGLSRRAWSLMVRSAAAVRRVTEKGVLALG